MVPKSMSFLGNTNFCTCGHAEHCQLYVVFQRDIECLSSSCLHICFFQLYFNCRDCLSCNSLVTLQFYLHIMVITMEATPIPWAYYFQGFGLSLSFNRTWSDYVQDSYITYKELQIVVLMLCRMAFHFTGKVVALHLNNSTAEAYLCNPRWYNISFQTDWHILGLATKHGITLIQTYIPSYNVKADYCGEGWFQSAIFRTKLRQDFISGSTRGKSFGSLPYELM